MIVKNKAKHSPNFFKEDQKLAGYPSPSQSNRIPFTINPQSSSSLLQRPINSLSLKTHLNSLTLLPKISSRTAINRNEEENKIPFDHYYYQETHSLLVAFPALAFSNTIFFAFNVRLAVGEDDSEEKLIGRFRREVIKASVLRECCRRRFFESSQEKRKRKSREAAHRNRKSDRLSPPGAGNASATVGSSPALRSHGF